MTTREIAIKWWGMLGTLTYMQLAHGFDSERFPEPPKIPPFQAPTVTGREIEQMWKSAGKPSTSMKFDDMQPSELLGRVVKIHEGHTNTVTFSFILAVTKASFSVFNDGRTFNAKNGSRRGGGSWDTTRCELSTREAWSEYSKEVKVKAERRKLVNAIIDHVQRKDSIAPTMEQLEAAAKELGLVKA